MVQDMKIKKLILNIVLKFFSIFLVFTKINKKKISFVSLESEKLEGDFLRVAEELEKLGEYELNYELVKFEKTLLGNFKYFIECIRQLFVINTSALVILDFNNYIVSHYKREGVKVLQLWHASGAIKQFGNLVERDYKIQNYDYAIVNSKEFIPVFAKGFSMDEKSIIETGIPKTDVLFNKEVMRQKKEQFLEAHEEIKGKKVILYAPTFRGRLMTDFKDVYLDIRELKKAVGDDYVILYKMHPLLGDKILKDVPGTLCCNSEDLYTLMEVSDMLISDYSALIIDYSTMHKPMYFYVPDLEEYKKAPGITFDYRSTMPGPVCYTEKELAEAIRKGTDLESIRQFQERFFPYTDGKSTERVVELIRKIMSV